MNARKRMTAVAKKQFAPTLQDHITVTVMMDTREMGTIAQVLPIGIIYILQMMSRFVLIHVNEETNFKRK